MERAVHLDNLATESGDLTLDALTKNPEGTDKEWAQGAEAYEAGDKIINCDYPPGIECDAWIMGWLWQGKQDEDEEG